MPLNFPAKGGSADFKPVAAGTYIAVCDMVVYLGVQPGSGLYPQPKPQVYIRFELPNERIEFEKDGKKQTGPAVLGKTYTASMNEKANLRHDLESWRGKSLTDEEAEAFDVSAILGKPCMVNIVHTVKGEKTYSNIAAVMGLMKGINPKTIIPEIVPLCYVPDNTTCYAQLPEWLRKKIDGQILNKPPATQPPPDSDKWDDGQGPLENGSYISDDEIPF
jgi:hypothetical protein